MLIIDGDMRLGELHKMFGMNPDSGLTDYLLQDKDSTLSAISLG